MGLFSGTESLRGRSVDFMSDATKRRNTRFKFFFYWMLFVCGAGKIGCTVEGVRDGSEKDDVELREPVSESGLVAACKKLHNTLDEAFEMSGYSLESTVQWSDLMLEVADKANVDIRAVPDNKHTALPHRLHTARDKYIREASLWFQEEMWNRRCSTETKTSMSSLRCGRALTTAQRREFLIVYPLGSNKLTSDLDVQMMLDFNSEHYDPIYSEKEDLRFLVRRILYLRNAFTAVSKTRPYSLDMTLDINFYPPAFLNFCWQKSGNACGGHRPVPGFFVINNYLYQEAAAPKRVPEADCQGLEVECLNFLFVRMPHPEDTTIEDIARADFKFPQTDLDAYYEYYAEEVSQNIDKLSDAFLATGSTEAMVTRSLAETPTNYGSVIQWRLMRLFEANYLGPEMYFTVGSIYFVVAYLQLLNQDLNGFRAAEAQVIGDFRAYACSAYVEQAIHTIYWNDLQKFSKAAKYRSRMKKAWAFLLLDESDISCKVCRDSVIQNGFSNITKVKANSIPWKTCMKSFYAAYSRAFYIQGSRPKEIFTRFNYEFRNPEYAFQGKMAEGFFLKVIAKLREGFENFSDAARLDEMCSKKLEEMEVPPKNRDHFNKACALWIHLDEYATSYTEAPAKDAVPVPLAISEDRGRIA